MITSSFTPVGMTSYILLLAPQNDKIIQAKTSKLPHTQFKIAINICFFQPVFQLQTSYRLN